LSAHARTQPRADPAGGTKSFECIYLTSCKTKSSAASDHGPPEVPEIGAPQSPDTANFRVNPTFVGRFEERAERVKLLSLKARQSPSFSTASYLCVFPQFAVFYRDFSFNSPVLLSASLLRSRRNCPESRQILPMKVIFSAITLVPTAPFLQHWKFHSNESHNPGGSAYVAAQCRCGQSKLASHGPAIPIHFKMRTEEKPARTSTNRGGKLKNGRDSSLQFFAGQTRLPLSPGLPRTTYISCRTC
jgi:hypothetical protein